MKIFAIIEIILGSIAAWFALDIVTWSMRKGEGPGMYWLLFPAQAACSIFLFLGARSFVQAKNSRKFHLIATPIIALVVGATVIFLGKIAPLEYLIAGAYFALAAAGFVTYLKKGS